MHSSKQFYSRLKGFLFLNLILIPLANCQSVSSPSSKQSVILNTNPEKTQDKAIVNPLKDNRICENPRDLDTQNRAINGIFVNSIKQWPGFVALRLSYSGSTVGSYFCGGTLVSPTAVLTAAHCLWELGKRQAEIVNDFVKYDDSGVLQVVYGTYDLTTIGSEEGVRVREFKLHDDYHGNPRKDGHDIAILYLEKSLDEPVSRLSQSVSLDPIDPPGDLLLAAGFGVLHPDPNANQFRAKEGFLASAGSARLMEVELPTVSESECKERYPQDAVGQGQICAGYSLTDRMDMEPQDTCYGDSGGPLIRLDRFGCGYQVGITSWGIDVLVGKTGVYIPEFHLLHLGSDSPLMTCQ
ncbi:S1 family serine peptidase [Methylomonas fluvii]|uniref:Serine protease n=1 Tax=Methylomonas fluvii TaxID=1854564 RepID=A0ABR9DHR2_9GAMM|nr:serine protease [Methylomonas fluvii]MBD9361764.1 serine protease [Methylomonas fluvii]